MLDKSRVSGIINPALASDARAANEIAGLCKGSTTDSDSVCEGSNPSPAAKIKTAGNLDFQGFQRFSRFRETSKNGLKSAVIGL